MKKKLVTKIMAFLMAILCLVGTMPAASVRAEDEQQKTSKEMLSELIETMEGVMKNTIVATDARYLPLFTCYTDADRYNIMMVQLKEQKKVLESDTTEEEYKAAYEKLNTEVNFFFEEWYTKEPSKDVLSQLISDVKSYMKNVDESKEKEDVTPGMIWIKPDVLEKLNKALETAVDTYRDTINEDEDNMDVYYKIYNACIDLEDAYNEVSDEGNSEFRKCTKTDVDNIINSLKNTLKNTPYSTKEEAIAHKAGSYVPVEAKNELTEAIKRLEVRNNNTEMTDGDYLITYNYAKRAANRYIKELVLIEDDSDIDMTKEDLENLTVWYKVFSNEKYITPILGNDDVLYIGYGEAYAPYDAIQDYRDTVDGIEEDAKKDDADVKALYIKLRSALDTLRKQIKYKETKMEDLKAILDQAKALKEQLKTAKNDDEIILNGIKGQQYVLSKDMDIFDSVVDYVNNNMKSYETMDDSIMREYYIVADAMYLKSGMSELASIIRIVNADNADLENMIDLAEDFVKMIYKADNFDDVPEGELWLAPSALKHINEYVANAKEALDTSNLTTKNKAYNALSTTLAKAKNTVKRGEAKAVTPDNDSVKDTTTEAVDTPQTGDTLAVYAYLAAALSAAVLALSVAGYRKVRK